MSAARCSLGPDARVSVRARARRILDPRAARSHFSAGPWPKLARTGARTRPIWRGCCTTSGSFALLATVPNTLRSLVATQANAPWGAIPEHAGRLGTIHTQIGAALLEKAALPFYISDAVLLHHAPSARARGLRIPWFEFFAVQKRLLSSRSPAHPARGDGGFARAFRHPPSPAPRRPPRRESALCYGVSGVSASQSRRSRPRGASRRRRAVASGAQQRLTETLVMRFVKEARTGFAWRNAARAECREGIERSKTTPATTLPRRRMVGSARAARNERDRGLDSRPDRGRGGAAGGENAAARGGRCSARCRRPVAAGAGGCGRESAPRCSSRAMSRRQSWPGWLVGGRGAARVELELSPAGQSLIARAARATETLSSYEEGKASQLAGLDLQIARMLGAERNSGHSAQGRRGPEPGRGWCSAAAP